MKVLLVFVAIAIAACSGSGGGGGGGTPATARPPEPTPTPHPWVIDVSSAKATTKTIVGGDVVLTVVIENSGKVDNPSLQFQLSDIKDYADIAECKPKCTISDLFGDVYVELPGVRAGEERTYKVEFVATKVGAVDWGLCVYDDADYGEQVYCGDITTRIR